MVNEPPVLRAVNGVEASHRQQGRGRDAIQGSVTVPGAEPGGWLELTVEADDPEGDAFGVWFPGAAARVEFDPHEREGAILLPEGFETFELELELRDEREDAMGAAYRLTLTRRG
jgi:hypothetical protein